MSDETIETPPRLRFDEAALQAYLAAHVEGFEGPMTVRKFAGGESNPTYLLETPGASYVLRRKPPGNLLPSAHAVDREFRVMRALAGTGVPVPAMRVLCEDETIVGTAFYVMDFIDGRVVWEKDLSSVDKAQRRGMVENAIGVQARLHGLDPQALGLGDFGKTGGYFERQVARWTAQYDAAATQEIPSMERLKAWLPDAVPEDDETSIVHGDYKIDNLIFAQKSPEVLAVLDWELSTLGHPLADFSYFLMAWGLPRITTLGMADIDFEAENIPTLDEAIALYCARTGRDGLPDIDTCMAYNMFRMAGIVQGVYKRSLQGNASSEKASQYGAVVPLLADTGWRFAKKAGA